MKPGCIYHVPGILPSTCAERAAAGGRFCVLRFHSHVNLCNLLYPTKLPLLQSKVPHLPFIPFPMPRLVLDCADQMNEETTEWFQQVCPETKQGGASSVPRHRLGDPLNLRRKESVKCLHFLSKGYEESSSVLPLNPHPQPTPGIDP